MTLPEPEVLNALVARVFRIEDITLGEPKQGFILRYRGRLLSEDSAAAYDQLAEALRPYGITPLFRMEAGVQNVFLAARNTRLRPSRPLTNLVFFILTLASVLFTGAVFEYSGSPNVDFFTLAKDSLLHIGRGWPFAASLLAILPVLVIPNAVSEQFRALGWEVMVLLLGAAVIFGLDCTMTFAAYGSVPSWAWRSGWPWLCVSPGFTFDSSVFWASRTCNWVG